MQYPRPARPDARAARSTAGERAQLPEIPLTYVLEHVEMPVPSAHAEVVGVAPVPPVEQIVDFDRVLAEDEAAGSFAGALGELHVDPHERRLTAGRPRASR